MADATVTIVNNVVSVAPDPLPAGTRPNVNLNWDIATDGWTFPSNGIVITDPDDQFSAPQATGKKFKWKDKNSNSKRYKYTINVTNGTRTLSRDPAIQNQG